MCTDDRAPGAEDALFLLCLNPRDSCERNHVSERDGFHELTRIHKSHPSSSISAMSQTATAQIAPILPSPEATSPLAPHWSKRPDTSPKASEWLRRDSLEHSSWRPSLRSVRGRHGESVASAPL